MTDETTSIGSIVARVRRAMPRNPDVMAVCDACERLRRRVAELASDVDRLKQEIERLSVTNTSVTSVTKRDGRPPLNGKVMTDAERAKLYRDRKREASP
jgi:hypothetical protein